MARWAAWTVLAAAGVAAVGGPASSAAVVPIRVEVDDASVALSPPPAVLDGVLYLPLRPLARTFGAELVADRQGVTVRRADGATFLVRAGRLEVWSGDLVWALASAPARLVDGTFMVPVEMAEALFGIVAVWDPRDHVLRIATPRPVRVEQPPRPQPPAGPPADAPAPFVPEFTPRDDAPLVASGYVSLAVTVGAPAISAVSAVQFQSAEGPARVEGSVVMAAHSGTLQTSGTVRLRGPTSLLTVGTFTFHDSPLTLYQQQLAGALYEGQAGPVGSTVLAGTLPGGGAVYGLLADLPAPVPWTAGVGFFSDPGTGASVTRLRAARRVGDLEAFGEYAVGAAAAVSGTAWRAGLVASAPQLSASLSYVWLDSAYPPLGNAALFGGRAGPLLELAYRPSERVLWVGHAAALSGAPSGLPDRHTYALLATYTPGSGSQATGEIRLTDDTAPGVWTRSVSSAASVAWTWGRAGVVVGASHVLTEDRVARTASQTSTLAARAGVNPAGGVPAWIEVSRSFGAADSWSLGLQAGARLWAGYDLVTRVRRTWSVPAGTDDTWLEAGVSRLLSTGSALTATVGVRYGTSAEPTPYITLQYGLPVHLYGIPRAGTVSVEAFVDADGDGIRGPGEAGVAGVVVRLDGRSAAQTADGGRATIAGVPEGDHTVSLEDSTIPAGLAAVSTERRITVGTGGEVSVAFALRPAAGVQGVVYLDDNHNGLLDAGEPGIDGIGVVLLPLGRVRTTGPGGAFVFDGLLPGDYQVAIDPQTLPAGLAVTDPAAVTVSALPGREVFVALAVRSGTPVIKKTFP